MPKNGTENALTIDANVVNYYFAHKDGHQLPGDLAVKRIEDFCSCVMDKHPIAYNDFIKAEYESVVGPELIKNWIKDRNQKNLAIDMKRCRLPEHIRVTLRDDYGFDCNSMDAKYIATCLATVLKHLITEDKTHFHRPHRSSGHRPLHVFLKRDQDLYIYTIDECCDRHLNS